VNIIASACQKNPPTNDNYLKGIRMARTVTAQIKLQVPGGQATPAPPVGPALGQHGVNIGQFVSQFNERSKELRGVTVPVVITVYSDRSFDFIIKSPPAAVLLKQAAGIPLEKKKGGEVINAEEKAKGSGKYKGFKVSPAQVRDIAQRKLQDLNARDVDHAMRIIEGTARSLGLAVEA
jgi:large subunit ribosomal protein L11